MATMVSLREARVAQMRTIRELATLASVAPSTIYLIEAGRTMARPRVMRQISQALGVDPLTIDEFRRAMDARTAPRRPPPEPEDRDRPG